MRKNKAVSAVIGVILMVAITVAIAATVFAYVTSLEEKQHVKEKEQENQNINVEGVVSQSRLLNIFVNHCGSCPNLTDEWEINFTDGKTNTFYFERYSLDNLTDFVYNKFPKAPEVGKHVRIYYKLVEGYKIVTEVKEIT